MTEHRASENACTTMNTPESASLLSNVSGQFFLSQGLTSVLATHCQSLFSEVHSFHLPLSAPSSSPLVGAKKFMKYIDFSLCQIQSALSICIFYVEIQYLSAYACMWETMSNW